MQRGTLGRLPKDTASLPAHQAQKMGQFSRGELWKVPFGTRQDKKRPEVPRRTITKSPAGQENCSCVGEAMQLFPAK